jgi:hypothetical protein
MMSDEEIYEGEAPFFADVEDDVVFNAVRRRIGGNRGGRQWRMKDLDVQWPESGLQVA